MGFNNQYFIFTFTVCLVVASSLPPLIKGTKETEAEILSIHATHCTQVPNIVYTLNAIDSLRKAFFLYTDEFSRAKAWSELFGNNFTGKWNVAVGYTTLLTNSTIFIEVSVQEKSENKLDKSKDTKPKETNSLYRIFN